MVVSSTHPGDGIVTQGQLEIILVQTADPSSLYKEMLSLTGEVNSLYCSRHSIKYESYLGIKVGAAPWMATYNRIFILHELLQRGYSGWLIYVDADAFISDLSFNLHDYLRENSSYCLIGGPSSTEDAWNINAGIFFLNFGDADGRALVSKWLAMMTQKVPSDYLDNPQSVWDEFPNDQWLLHECLKTSDILTSKTKKETRGIFNYRDGRYIKQAIRADFYDIEDRVTWIRAETRRVLANEKKLPYADLTSLANQYGSDKGDEIGNKHSYTLFYQFLFDGLRGERFEFIELGLLRGGPEVGISANRPVADCPSVRMWLDFFPFAYCHGFDISDFSNIKLDRFRFHRGDSGKASDLVRLKAAIPSARFILDDASHASYHQQQGFVVLFPMLESGGYYIIEDLDWQPEAYEAELPKCALTRDVFETFSRSGLLNLVQIPHWEQQNLATQIRGIHFLRRRGDGIIKLVAIQKR